MYPVVHSKKNRSPAPRPEHSPRQHVSLRQRRRRRRTQNDHERHRDEAACYRFAFRESATRKQGWWTPSERWQRGVLLRRAGHARVRECERFAMNCAVHHLLVLRLQSRWCCVDWWWWSNSEAYLDRVDLVAFDLTISKDTM